MSNTNIVPIEFNASGIEKNTGEKLHKIYTVKLKFDAKLRQRSLQLEQAKRNLEKSQVYLAYKALQKEIKLLKKDCEQADSRYWGAIEAGLANYEPNLTLAEKIEKLTENTMSQLQLEK